MIIIGDCQEKLLELDENLIDTCITDPPYELGFMGKSWDNAGVSFQKETWEKVYRVLKPGGFLLAFGGTRTWHRIAVAIEDAGFEIRDTICWLYGSGFPKSYNIGKGIDKRRGTNDIIRPWLKSLGSREEIAKAAKVTQRQVDHWLGENTPCPQTLTEKRFILICEYFGSVPEWSNEMYEKIGEKLGEIEHSRSGGKDFAKIPGSASNKRIEIVTSSATPEAELWEGWGTALKPAVEFIVVAMKPIDGNYVNNALKHGVSGLWIDGGRISPDEKYLNGYSSQETKVQGQVYGWAESEKYVRCAPNDNGRWPANVILDETSAEMLDEQTGISKGGFVRNRTDGARPFENNGKDTGYETVAKISEPDGGASRFFKVIDNSCSLCYNTYTKSINKESDLWKQLYVTPVEMNSKTTQAINENIAHMSVLERASEKLVQNVKSAGNLCDLCGIFIAHILVAIKNSDFNQEESQAMLDYIGSYKSSILIQNLVSFAELWENIDTIPTTKSLSILFGSVHHAITNYIQETKKSELLRFKYQAKASKKERNMGLEDLEDKQKYAKDGRGESHEIFTSESANDEKWAKKNPNLPTKNFHPTVKPLALMQYLVRLTKTPTGGIVLDPFMGSGTTGMACVLENRDFIGIEMDEEYAEIAKLRIEASRKLQPQLKMEI